MASYVPCEGSGQNAVNLEQYPSQPNGLGFTQSKTFGTCPNCPRTVKANGLAVHIKVNRHKPQPTEGA